MDAVNLICVGKLPSPWKVLQLLFLAPLVCSKQGNLAPSDGSCPNPDLSCESSSTVADSCCYNNPSGLFYQSQFWDWNPSIGPEHSWTIHGLFPNTCDGGHPDSCDPDRAFDDIEGILNKFGANDLLEYMHTYWLPNDVCPSEFWAHEWGKHGTCINTLKPECYPDDPNSPPHREVLDFFTIITNLFKTLDTFATLSDAGIEPSDTQTYSLDELLAPLTAKHGAGVVLECRNHALNQIFYPFHIRGPFQSAQFVPTDPVHSPNQCPRHGIKYPRKTGNGQPPCPTGVKSDL